MSSRTLILILAASATLFGCDKPVNTNTEVAKEAQATEIPRGSDILDELGITIQIESPFVTEAEVRAAFSHSYEVLGIADPGISGTGWKITIADSTDMTDASTEMQTEFKSGRTVISAPLYPYAGSHEATHFLMGEVNWNNWLPGYIGEFIAAQAEELQPPGSKQDSYEVLNRGILKMPFSTATKNADREGTIGVNSNGAYDGLRYALLRSIGDKIGQDNAHKLAREVYQLAARNRRYTGVEELQPIFERYGVGDCVLFAPGDKAGKYVDVFFNGEGVPVIVYKQIGDQGEESSFQSNLGIEYRKGGKVAYGMQVQTNPGGFTTDDGGVLTSHWADGLRVSIDGHSYNYTISNDNGTYHASRVKK